MQAVPAHSQRIVAGLRCMPTIRALVAKAPAVCACSTSRYYCEQPLHATARSLRPGLALADRPEKSATLLRHKLGGALQQLHAAGHARIQRRALQDLHEPAVEGADRDARLRQQECWYRPRARGSRHSMSDSATARWRRNSRACIVVRRAPARSSQSCSRACISCAALRVKVIASISPGCTPSSSRRTMRDTSSQVLPLPAQASTTTRVARIEGDAVIHQPVLPVILAAQPVHLAIRTLSSTPFAGRAAPARICPNTVFNRSMLSLRQFGTSCGGATADHLFAFDADECRVACFVRIGITRQLHVLAGIFQFVLQLGDGLCLVVEHAYRNRSSLRLSMRSMRPCSVRSSFNSTCEGCFGFQIAPAGLLVFQLPIQVCGNLLLPAQQPGLRQIIARQRIGEHLRC